MAYLLENPNPHGEHFYRSRRRCQHGKSGPHLIVLHTSEQLPDYSPPDSSAEALNRYAASTSRQVSWHYSTDSDSRQRLLPDRFTAWHAGGFNRCSLGVEQATRAGSWGSAPEAWTEGIIRQTAAVVARWSAEHGIPLTVLSREQVDAGHAGLVAHATLDPRRRSDPGRDYPYDLLLAFARGGAPESEEQEMKRGDSGRAVRAFQHALVAEARLSGRSGGNPLPRYGPDGDYGAETEEAVRAYQRGAQLPETGRLDGITAALLSRYIPVPQAREEAEA